MNGQVPIADRFWSLLDAACTSTLAETQTQELANVAGLRSGSPCGIHRPHPIAEGHSVGVSGGKSLRSWSRSD